MKTKQFKQQSSGQDECTPCKPGRYCDTDEVTETDLITKECPAGMYCPEGTDTSPNFLDNSCPAGFFCRKATEVCVLIVS